MDMTYRSNTGMSNSIFQVLSQGGLLLFSIYLIPLVFEVIDALRGGKYDSVAFFSIVVLEFVFTIFGFNFLMLILLAFAYAMIISRRKTVVPVISMQENRQLYNV